MTDERIKEELKPCPFCGGKASVFEMVGLNTGHCVQCESCGAGIAGFDTEDEAKETWNTRAADLIEARDLIKEMRECLLKISQYPISFVCEEARTIAREAWKKSKEYAE